MKELMGNLPKNSLIQYPTGRWGFVGSVDARLAYVAKDGSTPTKKMLQDALTFGPNLAGVKTRAWNTKEEALQAAKELGE